MFHYGSFFARDVLDFYFELRLVRRIIYAYSASRYGREKPVDELPNSVRMLRKARGLTLKQLAERIGKSHSYLQKMETGQRGLKPFETRDLARELDVPPADLLSTADGALTIEERSFIEAYRALPASMQSALRQMAHSFDADNGTEQVLDCEAEG